MLLEHSDVKVLFGSSGILLNLAADGSGDAVFRKNNCEPLDKLIVALDSFMLEDPALSCLLCKIFLNLSALVQETPRIASRLHDLCAEMIEGIKWAEDEEQARIPFLERITQEERDLYPILVKITTIFPATQSN